MSDELLRRIDGIRQRLAALAECGNIPREALAEAIAELGVCLAQQGIGAEAPGVASGHVHNELRLLPEADPDIVARIGSDFRFLHVNPAVRAITGLPAAMFPGKTACEVGLPPELLSIFEPAVREVIATGQMAALEFALPTARGRRAYESRLLPELGPAGSVEAVLVVNRDVTERHAAEKEAQDQAILLAAVHEAALDLAAAALERTQLLEAEQQRRREAEALRNAALVLNSSLDADWVIGQLADQLSQVVPYDCMELIWIEHGVGHIKQLRGSRQALASFVDSVHRLPIAATPNLQHMYETGRPMLIVDTDEFSGWHHLEPTGWVRSWAGAPIVVRGQVEGFMSVLSATPAFYTTDHLRLIEAFAAQAAMAIQNARLYQDLRQRMDELEHAQVQLVQSARLAAIGELAGAVAHELNNPLTPVLGFAELLLRSPGLDAQTRADLQIIATQARRARDVVLALLDFARQGQSQLEEADVNVGIQQTLSLIRRQFEERGVAVEEHYGDLPLLLVDSHRLKQVWLSLLTNALHALPHGGRLVLRTERLADQVVVRVADTGTGIAPAHLPHIFDPFYSTRPEIKSVGLGLPVSLGIVQDHGGCIEVESREGQGSVFTVWLPIRCPNGTVIGREAEC